VCPERSGSVHENIRSRYVLKDRAKNVRFSDICSNGSLAWIPIEGQKVCKVPLYCRWRPPGLGALRIRFWGGAPRVPSADRYSCAACGTARRYLSRDDEAWLCRYCAALALIDRKLIGQLRADADPLHALPAGSTLDDLFALISRAAIVDICQLSRRFQSTTGREWRTRPVSFDPSVWVGNIGASPDLLVGDCLLDLKTATRPRLERVWLDQLLLYTLVVGDRKRINRLGFHLLRQDRTITWPIDEFLSKAARGSVRPHFLAGRLRPRHQRLGIHTRHFLSPVDHDQLARPAIVTSPPPKSNHIFSTGYEDAFGLGCVVPHVATSRMSNPLRDSTSKGNTCAPI
jgi:hypothetical protein